jgi:glycosyltransferase involved in cell wall biosynthesis
LINMVKRKIYVVVPGGVDSVGGTSRFVRYYSRAWATNAYLPELRILDTYGINSKGQKPWKMPFCLLNVLTRVMLDGALGKIQLLHVNLADRFSLVRKGLVLSVAKLLNIPSVLHIHAAELIPFTEALPPVLKTRVAKLFRGVDRVIVLGDEPARYLIDCLGVPPANIRIVRNAVPEPELFRHSEPSSIFRFVFLGSLGERKGLHELLPALVSLRDAVHNWRITIAGNGDIEKYRRWSASLGLAERVEFVGWLTEQETSQLLSECDALVLPSRNEGLPLSILEAMAHGLAIISTPVGAIADAVLDGENGLIVPARDVERLVVALKTLALNPEKARRMGIAGRERYLREFSIASLTNQLAQIFNEVCAQRARPAVRQER